MANPVLVETTRGPLVENRHRGAIAVIDADGAVVLSLGDIDRPVFPRSSIKALQAIPLVECGAADGFGFDDSQLALACASHTGEGPHVSTAERMLEAAGLDEEALECGGQWPLDQQSMIDLAARGGAPSPKHNNCSGKHAGFLGTCRHLDLPHRGYVAIDHPIQQMVREVMVDLTEAPHAVDQCGHDGCSIPTYAIPLRAIASGFSRAITGNRLDKARAAAASRLISACMAEPYFVAGKGRAATRLMQAAPGRIFVKDGADGVYAGAIPEFGLGFALKVDDGSQRAAVAMVASALAGIFKDDEVLADRLRELSVTSLDNRKGIPIGSVRPAGPLA